MHTVFERHGARQMLDILERITRLGFDAARRSGASISPFFGRSIDMPPQPKGEDIDVWRAYREEIAERIVSRGDYEDDDLGPQLLAMKSGARGTVQHLTRLAGPCVLDSSFAPQNLAVDFEGFPFIRRHGFSDGLTPEEMFASAVPARIGMAMTALDCARVGYDIRKAGPSKGFTVLARAMRADRPGIVFAQAANTGEVDPLTDLDSRLFVGLPPK